MFNLRRLVAVAIVVTLGIFTAACGGSDNKTASTSATAKADSKTSPDIADFSTECQAFVSAMSGASASIGSALSGTGTNEVEQAAAYFNETKGKLPQEIRGDFAIFAAAYTSYAKALADAHIDLSNPSSMDPKTLAALQGLSKPFADPKVAKASANIETYINAHCKDG